MQKTHKALREIDLHWCFCIHFHLLYCLFIYLSGLSKLSKAKANKQSFQSMCPRWSGICTHSQIGIMALWVKYVCNCVHFLCSFCDVDAFTFWISWIFIYFIFFLSLWLLLTICYLFLFFSIRAKPSCLYERNVYLCLLHAI